MKIFVNNEQVDITWQDEKNLGDAYLGVQSWLQESGLAVQAVIADGNHMSLGEFETWETTPIEAIGELKITAVHPLVLEQQQLVVLLEYFDLLTTALEQCLEENTLRAEIEEILHEIPPILNGLRHLLGDNGTMAEYIEEILVRWDYPSSAKISEIPQVLSGIELARQILTSRIQEYQNPLNESLLTLSALGAMQPRLAQVSLQFREGNITEAQNTIHKLIDLLSKLARTLRLTTLLNLQSEQSSVNYAELEKAGNELNGLLDELAEGIENQDMILLGDLLEYELPEHFEKLSTLIREV